MKQATKLMVIILFICNTQKALSSESGRRLITYQCQLQSAVVRDMDGTRTIDLQNKPQRLEYEVHQSSVFGARIYLKRYKKNEIIRDLEKIDGGKKITFLRAIEVQCMKVHLTYAPSEMSSLDYYKSLEVLNKSTIAIRAPSNETESEGEYRIEMRPYFEEGTMTIKISLFSASAGLLQSVTAQRVDRPILGEAHVPSDQDSLDETIFGLNIP